MAIRVLVFEEGNDTLNRLSHNKNVQKEAWRIQGFSQFEQLENYILHGDETSHVVIIDLDNPDIGSLSQINKLIEEDPYVEWLVLYSDKSDHPKFKELESITFHQLLKPVDENNLIKIIRRSHRSYLTSIKLNQYSKGKQARYSLDTFVGNSDAVKSVKEMVARLVDIPVSAVTILGETGTGKGMTSRILHYNGVKKDGPLVEINCAALPRELLESELFGHESGAFTGANKRYKGLFEQADGGTLFLDEIGDMDIDLQSKLLKAIEDNKIRRLGSDREIKIDVDIIAATSVNLLEACQEGKFREDLYHRISTFIIDLPPLRDRKEDLLDIIPKTIAEFNQRARKNIESISDEAWDKLLNYSWPGNIRELRNVIERSVLLSKGDELPVKWLGLENEELLSETSEFSISKGQAVEALVTELGSLDLIEKEVIKEILDVNQGNVSAAAEQLGITREKLRYRIKKHGL